MLLFFLFSLCSFFYDEFFASDIFNARKNFFDREFILYSHKKFSIDTFKKIWPIFSTIYKNFEVENFTQLNKILNFKTDQYEYAEEYIQVDVIFAILEIKNNQLKILLKKIIFLLLENKLKFLHLSI